jgi:hypothetical protein
MGLAVVKIVFRYSTVATSQNRDGHTKPQSRTFGSNQANFWQSRKAGHLGPTKPTFGNNLKESLTENVGTEIVEFTFITALFTDFE